MLEDNNKVIFWKPAFMFGDEAPDTDQQLLAERISGSLSERRSTISHEQMPFSPLILPTGDNDAEDGLASDLDYGLSACGHLDVPRLQSLGTSSTCNWFV